MIVRFKVSEAEQQGSEPMTQERAELIVGRWLVKHGLPDARVGGGLRAADISAQVLARYDVQNLLSNLKAALKRGITEGGG